MKRLNDIEYLEKEISDLEGILASRAKQNRIIINDMKRIKKQYPSERRSELVYEDTDDVIIAEDHVEDYPVTVFLSKEGYFKKITPQSLRMNSTQTFKDGDSLRVAVESSNAEELVIFTSMQNAYKCKVCDFDDTKASSLGDYLPSKLGMDSGETVVGMAVTRDYSGHVLFFFENGRAARVPLSAYKTVANRRRLVNAYCDKFLLCEMFHAPTDCDFTLIASNGKAVVINSALIPEKTTKNTQGVIAFTQKGKNTVTEVTTLENSNIAKPDYYRAKALPAVGHFLRDGDLKKSDQVGMF